MGELSQTYLKDLKSGYYKLVDGEKCLKSEFIVEYPREVAKKLRDRNKNKLSQLWKFYDHARRIQDSLRQRNVPLDVLKAELNELVPAVNYAYSRETVTEVFKQFIEANIMQVKDRDELNAFIKHFQALIAYLPRENQK